MSITIEGTIIMRAGKICPEAIAQLSTEQLKHFLVIHALAPYPATLETEVQASIRAEFRARGAWGHPMTKTLTLGGFEAETERIGKPPVLVEAKSVVSRALIHVCPTCDAAIGELCKRPDGQYVSFKGHLGAHLARLPKKLPKADA